jgi:hypothetical protein
MRMRASISSLVLGVALACGPSVTVEPEADTGEGSTDAAGSTSAASQEDSGGPASAADAGSDVTGAEAESGDTGLAESSGGLADTGAEPWPVEGNGQWLCTGFEDPFFLTLEVISPGPAMGTLCVPIDTIGDPPDWSPCSELFDHFNVFGTSIYFAAHIENDGYQNGQLEIEAGFDYAPETDRLVGLVAANASIHRESCERYVP